MRGISMIEVMVVLAIVSILSFIGVGQVKDYMVKAHVTEALTLLENAKLNIIEELLQKHDVGAVSFPPIANMKSLKTVVFNQGKLIATADKNKIGTPEDLTLALTPITDEHGIISWECAATNNLHKFVPAICRHNL